MVREARTVNFALRNSLSYKVNRMFKIVNHQLSACITAWFIKTAATDKLQPISCSEKLLWKAVLKSCSDQLFWSALLISCSGQMFWTDVLISCSDQLFWLAVLISSGQLFWRDVLISCSDQLFWSSVLHERTISCCKSSDDQMLRQYVDRA